MRILAIRGCNLASLAGEFEIDLAHGPLGGAGVFAIVGNTGAGKSTLLDAMCVALFDRTPRLSAPSRVQVGRGPDDPLALGANDVRGILRRGASTGWAEVDFESGDARQYRARWSVRRARGHSAGNLQDQQMSCVALDGGERLGGTKTETLRCIQQRLGLSFDQFRRSALLAQGDFATFLRADGKDRSELLERMTGTEIYSRLSIAAHLRATEAEQGLRDRRGAAAAIAVLDDDARSAMESELAGATAAKASARERFAAAEVYLRWAVEGARRAGELASADRAHSLALAAISDADAHRAELALRRRAETLRSTWDEAARVDRDHALAAGATSATAGLADAARGQCAEHTHRRSQLASAHAPIRAARIAAGIVERLAPPPALAGATAGAALGIAAVAQVEARVAKATEDAAWLVAHAGVAPEIAAWPEVDAKLAQHVALAETIAQLDRELAARATERSRLEASCAVAKAAQREASAQLELAQRKAATFRERRGGLTLDAARRQEDDARQRCVEVARLAAVAEAARLGVDARATLDREASTLETAAASDRDAGVAAASARAAADEVRVEREREIETLRRIAGHAHARTELVDGEACPLCGATEHPWEARGEMSTAIRDAERRLAQVKKRLEAAVAEVAALSARDTQRVAERARLASRRVALDHDATSAAVTWRAQLAALGELMLVDDPADPAAGVLAGERAVAAGASLEQTRAARAHVEAGVKAAADAQAQTLARQVELDHTTLRVADLECTRRELDIVLHRARGERAARSTHRSELALSILGALARWSPLPAEPAIRDALARLHRGLPRSLADSWPATDAAAALPRDARPSTPGAPSASSGGASTADATAGVSPRNAARETRGRAPRAGANRGDAHRDDASERQVREALEAEARLAGGRRPPEDAVDVSLEVGALLRVREAVRAVVEIWRRCADAVADADAAMSAALAVLDRSVGDAERELANAEARYAEALARRDALGLELAAIGARLEVARVAAGFDADELRRLLAADATRADQLADELASLDRAVERARAVVAERARELDEHLAARPPGTPVDQPVRSTSAESNPADPHLTARAPGAVASFAGEHPVYATSAESSAALGRAREIEAGAVRRDAVCGLGPEAVASIGRVVEAARREVDDADARVARVAAELAADGAARGRKTSALAALAAAESACEVDRVLGEVIGSHDGKLFRSFAQSLTLDGLLAVANAHLEELAPRYQLERVPRHDLELQVIDRDLGAEVRSVHSLSGGESFLVSLALALGLSSMSAHDVRVRTLLIDEGFGTLDPSTLDTALAVLDRLQATGRQVGVISHVPALVERVGAHVRIIQRGGGRSEVVVADA